MCKDAGITVRMVTGDTLPTARAISLEAGILSQEELKNEFACMTGKDFRTAVGEIVQDKDVRTGLQVERPKDVDKFTKIVS